MVSEKKNLLNYDSIKTLLESDGEHKKAQLIADNLNRKIFMRKVNDVLYLKDEERNYYRQIINEKDINDEILNEVTLLLEKSKDNLECKQKDDLKLMFKEKFTNLSKNTTVSKIMPQIRRYITIDEDNEFIKNLDNTKGEIHFYNGYIDMKTKEFKKRDINKKPVTFVIQRNYKPSTTKQRKFLHQKLFGPIFPNKDDLKIILLILGSAMTGNSSIDQSSLFWLGDGSNGKSFVMELLKVSFGDYVFEFINSTFESGNKDKNKVLNSFLIHKYIRLAWVNEFSSKPIDESTFKDFVDGVIKTTSLYKDGQNIVYHLAKVISTMNEIPKFIASNAMNRRIDGYTGQSKFVDNIDEVDESKHIYAKNKTLKNFLIENGYLDALVDIVVKYASEWINGTKIEPDKNNNMCKSLELIKDSNDKMKDFTDKYLIKTTNGNDRIDKNMMYELYKKQNPKSLITLVQLIDALKKSDIKIEYNKDLRNKDNTRGAFFGVKFRDQNDDDDEDDEPKSDLTIEQQIINLENQKYGIEAMIMKLKQQLPIKKEDIKEDKEDIKPVVKEVIKTTNDNFDVKEEKPKKSKSTTKYIDPVNKKSYEIHKDYEIDQDIKLF